MVALGVCVCCCFAECVLLAWHTHDGAVCVQGQQCVVCVNVKKKKDIHLVEAQRLLVTPVDLKKERISPSHPSKLHQDNTIFFFKLKTEKLMTEVFCALIFSVFAISFAAKSSTVRDNIRKKQDNCCCRRLLTATAKNNLHAHQLRFVYIRSHSKDNPSRRAPFTLLARDRKRV